MPMRTGSAPSSRPATIHIAGASAVISPPTSFRIVDLPQPDGPTSATKSPLAMRRVVSSSAVTAVSVAAPVGDRDVLELDHVIVRSAHGRACSSVLPLPAREVIATHGLVGVARLSPAASAGCVCTERPWPRVPRTSSRSRITKRPRTMVWIGRPFTLRPCHGEIFARDCDLGVVDDPLARRGRRWRCRHRRPARSRPCADRGPRSWRA